MIGFEMTEEQKQLQAMARRFAKNEIRPIAAQLDETGEFNRDLIEKAWELGLMNLTIPEEYGGSGLSALDECIVTEEMAWGCAGLGTMLTNNDLALTPILLGGTKEQKEELLVPICKEGKLASICLTEPGSGSDVSSLSTRARKVDGGYVLNGSKCFITNGSYSDLLVVFATIDPALGHRGITVFAVPGNSPGVVRGKKENKMGQRGSNTAEVIFQDVFVAEKNRIGEEGQGFQLAMETLDQARPVVGAAAVGLAKAALEESVKYAKERKQFGRPISHFQGVQFMLADMAQKIEASRLLVWQSAWRLDQGYSGIIESAAAKCFSTDVAMEVTTDAVQIFGGYGYMKDFPVEKMMRDAKIMQIYEGTNQIQRLVIGRELVKQY